MKLSIACSLLLSWHGGSGFQPVSLRHVASSRSSNRKATTVEEEYQVIDVEFEPVVTESARLTKAKKLLAQFTVEREDNNNGRRLLLPSSSGSNFTTSAVNGVAASRTPISNGDNSDVTNNNVVPDQFWSNGHLQGGDYVTRWARGQKIAEPLVRYDPVVAEKVLFKQPAKWIVRNAQIAFPMGFWAVGVVSDYLMGRDNRRKRAQQLLNAITYLGPAIIKGGQALSSRPDLLPSEYLEELQKLQDDVPRFSNELAFQTVEEELGVAFDDVFELVEEEPVAAASIGQVYKARLLSNGDTVALKIQRPKCEEIIALDLYILRWWSGVYNQIFRLLNRDIDLQSVIDDFGTLIYREIDYVAEAANAQRFNELYAGVTDVFVPKIYSELTTSKVLTMEWVDGFRLTDEETLSRYGLDPSKLVNTLVQCSLKQVLENGYFHADPHAGNLLACPDGRLCYLDFGMMSFADTQQRNGFLLAVVHIVNRDWGELVRLYQKLGFIPEGTDLKPIEVALENALPDVLNADISELNFKNVVNKLGDIMYTYPFSLPPFYIAIIRCLGVLEGLAIQVDPQARIVSKAYPYVASRVLTDPQDDLQEALRRLALTSDGKVRWNRLESLLQEAKETSDYDVAAAVDMLTSFLISTEGEGVVEELTKEIVEAADSLGSETYRYVFDAARALVINDEVAAVKAFRSLQDIVQQQQTDGFDGVRQRVEENLREVLPEATPSMQRFGRILALLGAQGGQADPAKFVPILRKLGQEPRIQRTLNEIVAKLGERMLSRGLRAAFGLPPPIFGAGTQASTVTEDTIK
ncbi:protein kinase UbiB [Seminavis robusta]|uniref:Protein kinase UbiB n=1 Tax=Seminavis robusta TaxID=568900 RepID=A0A9N8EXQ7_9STRA|nr:protein kinase UbiB [Seminavis robusta]|eukprot:Sro2015_g311040.1 protein kinase UbiB (806) ;mRNA; f:933-3877